jgi:hypothetical protein
MDIGYFFDFLFHKLGFLYQCVSDVFSVPFVPIFFYLKVIKALGKA